MMIHVCFVLHDSNGCYSKFTGTAMLSLFENTPPLNHASVTIHILHDNTLKVNSRENLSYIAGRYNQLIKFHNVEELCFDRIARYVNLVPSLKDSRISVGAFYKFLIPQIIPTNIEKIIYLDSDIIVNLDINKLWRIELGCRPLGVVSEISNGVYPQKASMCCHDGFVEPENYFNSGVLLMNLEILRREDDAILAGVKFRGEHPEYRLFDQEILNYCFASRILKLPRKFNCLVKELRRCGDMDVEENIYHFAGGTEALVLDMEDPFNRLWMDYFFKTPWFNASIINNLYNYIEEFGKKQRNSLINLSVAMTGKTRVFVLDGEKDVKWLKKSYSINNNEEIFIYNGNESLQKLIDKMNAECDKKIFFVRVNGIEKHLEDAGFVVGKDFFNHFELFDTRVLKPKDGYRLIKAI